MNNFPSPNKYQMQDDIGCYGGTNRATYAQRHTRSPPSRNLASKHTNTPTEFMLCSRCHERLDKKQETYANCPLGDCDRSLAEYSKALNYINSCHGIINQMMKQTSKDCSDFMRMPDLPNFMNLFHSLTSPLNTPSQGGEGSAKSSKKSTHESRYNSQLFNDGSRNNSGEKNSRPISPQLYPGRQQNSEDPAVKMTMKGKFIELLPDVKQSKYKKQDNFSPGTTESEESDLELNLNIHKNTRISMPNKFKNKIKTSHEKVIYEEENVEDDCRNVFKKDQDGKFIQKSKDDPKNKKISAIPLSPTPARNKPSASSPLPTGVTANTAMINENNKKLKQRSSSTVTPREKSKFIGKRGANSEVATNFSDTIITAGSIVGQGKKFGAKTLCTPIDIRNNELSQQELDKYAKELLGSESPSSRSPRSKSPASTACRSSTSPDKLTKNDQQDKNKRFQKPIPSPTLKSQAADQKRRNSQEKSSIPSNNGNNVNKVASASTTNIQQRQEQQTNGNQQAKKYRKSYTAQHQQQMEQNQNKKVNSCRRNPNPYSSNIPQHQNKSSSCCYGNSAQSCIVGENNYSRSKSKESRVQEESFREKATIEANNEDTEKECCSCHLDQLNLLCDNTETLSMRARVTRISKILTTPRKISPQYSVTTKPNDFFTNRKENHAQVTCDKEEDVESEGNQDSDDIKTDSDIEEDRFEKEDDEGSHSASAQMTQVLTRLGLSSSASEVQQLIQEAKSTRAHDEYNRPFREPRKAIDHSECIAKLQENNAINEVYHEESTMSQLRRTISEESSDIKSDDEMYANMENTRPKTTIPYNFCLGTGRYQS